MFWTEHDLQASDGTAIKLLEGTVTNVADSRPSEHVVVVYFQGYVWHLKFDSFLIRPRNASSLPPRLPYLSSILKEVTRDQPDRKRYTIVALSYRGFWKSRGRPSQGGIELDAEAALRWVHTRYDPGQTKIVVWGQSIGAGAATVSLANLLRDGKGHSSRISALLLETPFVDLKAMLVALYPQKFLPYRYLTPFLWSTWDSKTALRVIGESKSQLSVLILEAGDDEIVPTGQAAILEQVCKGTQMTVDRKVVAGALHTEVMVKGQGRKYIVNFLQSF